MPTTSDFQAHADAIAHQIHQMAMPQPGEAVGWMIMQHHPDHDLYRLEPAGYSLYDGDIGMAIFLAAHAALTGNETSRRLAIAALGPTRSAIAHHGAWLAGHLGLGGASGLGSVMYALPHLATWLEAPFLLDEARQVAALVTPEAVAADDVLDPIGGSAGAVLGLLAVHAATGDEASLAAARICGDHLLTTRQVSAHGSRAWPTLAGRLLTGFSHGAAGIAFALDRLARATGDHRYREAADEGLAYERAMFRPDVGNWPDLRFLEETGGEPTFMSAWCHGAPGIGLARLGMGTDPVAIESALAATRALGSGGLDHLCCGAFGRIELLVEAGDRLDRPVLREEAEQLAREVLARREANGFFRIFGEVPGDAYSPGFHRGTAGIGYALLRLAHPGKLPSVLLWE
jgi:type 2 lantibiotic biosynthesis protein LanM